MLRYIICTKSHEGMALMTLFIITFALLKGVHHGSCEDAFLMDSRLETDCRGPPAENKVAVITDVSYPFRADYFTLHECMAYRTVFCSPTHFYMCRCDENNHGRTDYKELSPFYKSHFKIDCSTDDGWRSLLKVYTQKFSIISPRRALTVKIRERNDIKDPVHSDVFGPVRDPVIDITIKGGATTVVTSKIYDIGILPSLVALQIEHAMNLSIKRRDFNLIPNVRVVVFSQSTIVQMEPYTFTDLPNLSGLTVDNGLYDVFGAIERFEQRKRKGWRESPAGLWTAADFDTIHRIHCDCSFAWYRNFLKSKPELIEFKQRGAMAVIGNYMSEYFARSDVASVDCAKNVTKENYHHAEVFSYNSTCFGPC